MPKCISCSAPLPKSGIICSYCGTRNDIDLGAVKSFRNLRPDLHRVCPTCKIELITIDIGNKLSFYIERCEKCYGLFFDLNELEELVENSVEKSQKIDLIKLAQITENPRHIDEIIYRDCPVCQKKMQRKNFMKRSGVIMDVCFEHGIWLDAGELRQIMEWIKLGGEKKVNNEAETLYKKKSNFTFTEQSLNSTKDKEFKVVDIVDFLFDIISVNRV